MNESSFHVWSTSLPNSHPKPLRSPLACSPTASGVPDSIVVHNVGEGDPKLKKILNSWGIATATVQPFDLRHGPSNKLSQLESHLLQSADYVVLCDCDLAFCASIVPWIRGTAIRACIASLRGPSEDRWAYLFRSAGLELTPSRMKAMVANADTLPSYCNSGLLIIPQEAFRLLRQVWPKWQLWLLDRPNVVGRYFSDQISFAMACEDLQLKIDHLPIELNFHTRPIYSVNSLLRQGRAFSSRLCYIIMTI